MQGTVVGTLLCLPEYSIFLLSQPCVGSSFYSFYFPKYKQTSHLLLCQILHLQHCNLPKPKGFQLNSSLKTWTICNSNRQSLWIRSSGKCCTSRWKCKTKRTNTICHSMPQTTSELFTHPLAIPSRITSTFRECECSFVLTITVYCTYYKSVPFIQI